MLRGEAAAFPHPLGIIPARRLFTAGLPKRIKDMKKLIALMLAALVIAACATTTKDTTPADVRNNMLVGESGMTLYVFDRDTVVGKSACNGPCATNWPPLVVIGNAQPVPGYTILERDDGRKQWAYK